MIFIGACFSPWRGEENGSLSIVWGNTESSRNIILDLADPELTGYKVFLKGPDGIQQEYDFSGVPGASFSVAPGTWNVIVKGGTEYLSDYPGEEDDEFELKILGMSKIEVKAGEKTTEIIDMYNAVEVWDWSFLNHMINNENFGICSDPLCDIPQHEVIIVLKSETSEDLSDGIYEVFNTTINVYNPVIIVADNDITIKRLNDPDAGVLFDAQFFNLSGLSSRLTLGLPGMNGRITIDGYLEDINSEPISTEEAISVLADSTLVMNEGVSIIRNTKSYSAYGGGAVFVNQGTFNMNGGNISGNKAYVNGGGIYITGLYPYRGVFNMTGGTISGNEAILSNGGGVRVDYGSFNMTGGTISGNTAYGGGGVFITGGESDGKFRKTGNSVIYGSDATSDLKNTALLKQSDGITSSGHAVYMNSYPIGGGEGIPNRIRNTTAGAGVNLDVETDSGWEYQP